MMTDVDPRAVYAIDRLLDELRPHLAISPTSRWVAVVNQARANALAALTPQLSSTGLREKVAATLIASQPGPYKWPNVPEWARENALKAADAILAMLPGGTGCLPDDVVRLVIAARAVAFGDDQAEVLRELDQASEAFASRVPWDDEPDDAAMLSALPEEQGEGKPG